MEYLLKLLLLSAVTFVVCQEPPEMPIQPDRCVAPAELLYRQCCLFPPFFTRDTAIACGAIFQVLPMDEASKFTGLQRISPNFCGYWNCILKKYDLLGPDGNADIVRYFAHLDKWVELNPLFSNVMSDAKIRCKDINAMNFPFKPCQFHDFHKCIRSFIDRHCPMIVYTEKCKEKREFMEECAEFYS